MNDNGTYRYNERHEYDPGPCSRCSGTDVRVSWHDVGTYGHPDAWMPGLKRCLNPECPSNPRVEF